MNKTRFIFLIGSLFLTYEYSYCQIDKVDNCKELYAIEKPNSDLILTVFKQFWPKLDSIELELKSTLKFAVEYPKEESAIDMSYRYYLDTMKYTIRLEGEAIGISELRALFYKNSIKLISSSFNGTSASVHQTDFSIYNYNFKTKELSIDSIDTKLFQVQLKDYFKEGTPDSIISYTSSYTSYFFDIVYNEKGIATNQLYSNSFDRKFRDVEWLRGNVITFEYKDSKFIRSEPYFSEDF